MMPGTNPRLLVVHPGQAHRDDFLVVSICLGWLEEQGLPLPLVARREPTPEEMEDPDVWVLDVGGKWEPAKGNWDHHQLPREASADCALSLWARGVGLEPVLSLMDWYQSTRVMDSKGPMALARELGCEPKAIFRNLSPIEGCILDLFGQEKSALVSEGMIQWMTRIGRGILDHARAVARQVETCRESAQVLEIGGVQALLIRGSDTRGVQKFRDMDHPLAGISLSWDDRGSGWSLYRFDDHPRVDFSRVGKDSRVLFAHAGGFIAKTKERISEEEVIALVMLAIKEDE